MSVNFDCRENILTAFLSGDIDHHAAAGMREAIDQMAESALPGILILDFSDVSFMDSSGIGLILGRYKLMQSMNGTLRVSHVSSRLKKLMQVAGLSLLPISIS